MDGRKFRIKRYGRRQLGLLVHFIRCAVEGSMIRIDLKQENFFSLLQTRTKVYKLAGHPQKWPV